MEDHPYNATQQDPDTPFDGAPDEPRGGGRYECWP